MRKIVPPCGAHRRAKRNRPLSPPNRTSYEATLKNCSPSIAGGGNIEGAHEGLGRPILWRLRAAFRG
jgi:hypothetical protein